MDNTSIKAECLHILKETHNYNKWIYDLYSEYLDEDILEIGCGIGNNTKYLLENNKKVFSIDINSYHLNFVKNRFKDVNNLKVKLFDISSNDTEIITKKFKTITCINVLHHINNQNFALKNMYKLLDDDGKFILFEPALPQIYGYIDNYENSFRRYSKNDIHSILIKNDFKVDKISYINILGVIPWFINGKILKKKIIHKKQTKVFNKIVPLIRKIEKRIELPIGLSLLCVCTKKKSQNEHL